MDYTSQDTKIFPIETGVYSISFQNSDNPKCYVGSSSRISFKTGYLGIRARWNSHLSLLRLNKHYSKKLQNAYNKYGEANMMFRVLEITEPDKCLLREDYYISKLDSCYGGYNTKPLATSCRGTKSSQESINKQRATKRLRREQYEERVLELLEVEKNVTKISKQLRISSRVIYSILRDHNLKHPRNGEYKIKEVYGYVYPTGEYLNKWTSAKECAQDLKLKSTCTISHIASGRHISYKNYWFSYVELKKEEAVIAINERILKGKNSLSIHGKSQTLKNIHQYDLNGRLLKIWADSHDIKEHFKLYNLSKISAVFTGRAESYKGCFWRREDQLIKTEL